MAKKLVLAVIDGLTPAMLEHGLERRRLPTLRALHDVGQYAVATTTFPSVTPVCLTSLATGAHPDVHHIPHLVWYHRGERRFVEYGSSFSAIRAAGARRAIRDSVFEMNHVHLARGATTVFEALDESGVETAAINFTCYRGRTRHAIRLPALAARNRWYEAAYGPRRFFFFNVFESDATGAPLAVRSRLDGSVDAYAAAIGRWLVTRDGFDFLVFYLPDYDYASHATGPDGALGALERADARIGTLVRAAGGLDLFLDRYAVVVCSDHGQTKVHAAVRLEDAFAGARLYRGRRNGDERSCELAVAASNRAASVYRLPACTNEPTELAERLDGAPGVDVVLFREGEDAVARRDGEELRFRPADGGWELTGDPDVLDAARYPDALQRAWSALACPNSGDLVLSAAEGFEFVDLGGRHHAGGGSHGSLVGGDSLVPVVAVGLEGRVPDGASITDVAPLALAHFGVGAPASMRTTRTARA